MAEAKEGKARGPGKGFSGLSSMVSDVDTTVANAERAGRAATDASGAASQRQTTQRQQTGGGARTRAEAYQQPPSQRFSLGGLSASKWLLGIGVVSAVIWLLSGPGNKSATPSPTYTPSPRPPVTSSPVSSWQHPSATSRSQGFSRPSEEKPPVGSGLVLSIPQIRYCVAEDIRLDAARAVVNNFVEADVDRFNAMVSDFNSRCGHFRYRQGELARAKADIERVRPLIEAEGRKRFATNFSSGAKGAQMQSADTLPRGLVRKIQQLLNRLGYHAGDTDGIAGAKTSAAIKAFQRDQRLQVDGEASTWVLTALLKRYAAVHKHARPKALRGRGELSTRIGGSR